MGYTLRDGLSCCTIGERVVFLDRAADRYFGLSAAAEARFCAVLAGHDSDATDAAERLIDQSLLVRTSGSDRQIPCTLPTPDREIVGNDASASMPSTAMAAISFYRAKRALRIDGWSRAIEYASRASAAQPARSSSTEALAGVARSFHRLALWVPSRDACVPRSMAIVARCAALGQPVSLIVGVRLDPFAAHCWVQRGTMLVGERLEVVASFTPIWAP